jgi:4-aminobutyrate aminotransferase
MEAFKKGLLILGCGSNTLRCAPPLLISREEVDWAMDCLDQVFGEVAALAQAK